MTSSASNLSRLNGLKIQKVTFQAGFSVIFFLRDFFRGLKICFSEVYGLLFGERKLFRGNRLPFHFSGHQWVKSSKVQSRLLQQPELREQPIALNNLPLTEKATRANLPRGGCETIRNVHPSKGERSSQQGGLSFFFP